MAADPGEGLRAVTYYCHIMALRASPLCPAICPMMFQRYLDLVNLWYHTWRVTIQEEVFFGYCLDRHIFELMFMALISGT